jgi:NAD(P)-dependent dehydrogenase (short-subunit alcohol dehydrogenase family)
MLMKSRLPKVTAHYADVSDPESVEQVIADIINEHGKIDNLVTSAGFTENFDAINYPIDRVRKLWGVNVDGYAYVHSLTHPPCPTSATDLFYQNIPLRDKCRETPHVP